MPVFKVLSGQLCALGPCPLRWAGVGKRSVIWGKALLVARQQSRETGNISCKKPRTVAQLHDMVATFNKSHVGSFTLRGPWLTPAFSCA